MITQRVAAVLLSLPLLVLLLVTRTYWSTYGKQEKSGSRKRHIAYKKFFLALVGMGYFGIWIVWIGGIVLLFMEKYYAVCTAVTCSFLLTPIAQIIGLIILYIGSLFFAWAIAYAGKALRPSTSGVHDDHILMQDGPLGVVRHPYYVSYVILLVGLGLTFATCLPLVLALLVVLGMVPTADAEEKQLQELFGDEYTHYMRRVGRFIPKIFQK